MKPDHIIQKVFVEITVNNKEKAFSIKDDINSFLSIDVFPLIEKYLNDLEYDLNDYILQIPKLELDLDVKNSTLNDELKNNIVRTFKEKISEMINTDSDSNKKLEFGEDLENEAYFIDSQEKLIQTFLYFLENGSMPWWNSDKKNTSFLQPHLFNSLISYNGFKKSILPLFSKQNVRERLIGQFSNEQIAQLCLIVLNKKEIKIDLSTEILQHFKSLNITDRQSLWRLILEAVAKCENTTEIDDESNFQKYILDEVVKTIGLPQIKNSALVLKAIAKTFPFIIEELVVEKRKKTLKIHQEDPKNLIEKTLQQEEKFLQKNEHDEIIYEITDQHDGYYINNAGLILIHPFIKTFFEHCDLLDTETKQLTAPELCAHLLHFIATGKTNAPEYEMIFEKFLCNIPLNLPINRHIKLSRKHKIQAKNLIKSVQQNWSPMKNSSVALLQNEFFQRPGKLIVGDYDFTLTVERKTQDILLDKLAWGIGLVKLPWKEKFIYVNW